MTPKANDLMEQQKVIEDLSDITRLQNMFWGFL